MKVRIEVIPQTANLLVLLNNTLQICGNHLKGAEEAISALNDIADVVELTINGRESIMYTSEPISIYITRDKAAAVVNILQAYPMLSDLLFEVSHTRVEYVFTTAIQEVSAGSIH